MAALVSALHFPDAVNFISLTECCSSDCRTMLSRRDKHLLCYVNKHTRVTKFSSARGIIFAKIDAETPGFCLLTTYCRISKNAQKMVNNQLNEMIKKS